MGSLMLASMAVTCAPGSMTEGPDRGTPLVHEVWDLMPQAWLAAQQQTQKVESEAGLGVIHD
jgi:hypothetical protein